MRRIRKGGSPGRSALDQRGRASPVVQFAAAGLVAVVVLGFAGTLLFRHQAQKESIRDAEQVTELLARGVITPNLANGIVRGDPRAVAMLDRVVRRRVIRDPVVRVKLWTPDGRIVYSDERRLIGTRYPLRADEQEAIRTGGADAELSDLSRPENRFERPHKKLLEVYLPVETPARHRLLFEAYLRYGSIASSDRKLLLAFAPALLIGLLLLWIILLPLAMSLARRLRAGQREREALLLRALNASDLERRRIAADLHDGVVQDLAGTSYALAVAADRAGATPSQELAGVLQQGATSTRNTIQQLRSLLIEIYPPSLREAGLAAALDDLASRLRLRGVQTDVEVADDLELSSTAERLIFRAAQEALRNVAEHSAATTCRVAVRSANGQAELLVEDDGRGFEPVELERRRSAGHVGLSLLTEAVGDAGGELNVHSSPGKGTTVRLWVPT